MASLLQLPAWVPPLQHFFPPKPAAYQLLQTIFSYFPLVTVAQWLNFPQPTGKTSLANLSILNYPGRYAWVCMELVGPLNMAYILLTLPQRAISRSISFSALPPWNKAMGLLYILHYTNRAFITPVFLAPSIAPIHLVVALSAACFNFINSSLIGGWVAGYGPGAARGQIYWDEERSEVSMWLGLGLFAAGMAGNIWGENTLFALRRRETARKHAAAAGEATKTDKKTSNPHDKVYVLPPSSHPLFSRILYPHYVLEWLEWTGFLLIGGGLSISSSTAAATAATGVKLLSLGGYSLNCECVPALIFLVNEVACMAPRAYYGRKWYEGKFGKEAVGGRGGVLPRLG